jgi:NTP pyrophosphatase (non-canonical NTP hydrolase)
MIKNTSEYPEMARKTAIYPNIGSNYQYPLLGLMEEAGEIDEKIQLKEDSLDNMIKEIGDVYWYLASCSFELGLDFNLLLKNKKESSLTISVEASKISGYLKKIMRDDNGQMTEKKKELIIDSLEKVCFLLTKYQKRYNLDTLDILNKNLEKLYSRKKRGVLKGSGDNR